MHRIFYIIIWTSKWSLDKESRPRRRRTTMTTKRRAAPVKPDYSAFNINSEVPLWPSCGGARANDQ